MRLHPFLTSALDGVTVNFTTRLLSPGKERGTHSVGGFIGPQTVWTLHKKQNLLPMPGLETLIFHAVTCHNKTEVSRFIHPSTLGNWSTPHWTFVTNTSTTDWGNSVRDGSASENLTAKQSSGME
jgi:hypothetical protein